jgi:hypothetical protein
MEKSKRAAIHIAARFACQIDIFSSIEFPSWQIGPIAGLHSQIAPSVFWSASPASCAGRQVVLPAVGGISLSY